jgi:hypothetical protein
VRAVLGTPAKLKGVVWRREKGSSLISGGKRGREKGSSLIPTV